MKKKLCLILISIFTIFSLTSCMRPKEKVIGDFVCIQEYNSYSIVGLSEEGKTKKELVIPSKINDREVYLGYTFSMYDTPTCNFESKNLEILYFNTVLEISILDVFVQCPNLNRIICLEPINYRQDIDYINMHSSRQWVKRGEKFDECNGYIYVKEPVIVHLLEYLYLPGNVVYFLNENEDIYYIDFCENITMDNLPKNPKRVGYKFLGWYKEKECINKWNIEKDVLPEIKRYEGRNDFDFKQYEVTKLYAKWEEIK